MWMGSAGSDARTVASRCHGGRGTESQRQGDPARSAARREDRKQLTRTVGSEVTVHAVVITTSSGTVIDVSGNGAVPIADLRAVPAGILPP